MAASLKGLEAREHTAQVPANIRKKPERLFQTATLSILFCSPTMDLAVDIAELNVGNLRSMPPTPANYAKRSGRGGRSGQSALEDLCWLPSSSGRISAENWCCDTPSATT